MVLNQPYHMKFFNPEIETMPVEKLRKLQSERLVNLVNYLYKRVPYYTRLFEVKEIDPKSIKGIEDIHKLPFTYKQDLRENYPFGLFAVAESDIIRIHASSGTTGKPTVVGYTRDDIEMFSEVVARSLVASGCQPGMKLQNAYGYGLFTGGLGLHYGGEKLGMAVIPVSGGMTDRQIMLLQDFKPDAISCTPSYAQRLCEELEKREIDPASLNLKTAILGAEPWTEVIREQVEAGLGVNAVNIYGLSEIVGPGVSNEDFEERGSGSYIWEDHFFPEVIDKETGEPVAEGEYGVLVFTTLTKQGMPLLRYWTNDITNIYYDKMGKRTHIKMGSIRGRADDMLIIRGVNLFHTQVEEVLKEIRHLSPNYQLIVTKDGIMDNVKVRVEIDPDLAEELNLKTISAETVAQSDLLKEIQGKFRKKIKDQIGLSMEIELEAPHSIPRSEGGKLSRIVDLRHVY